MYQIDAFTKELFKGNPAAVVPLGSWLPDSTLQAIASENNLAETAFFVQVDKHYEIRWFTPVHEAPLCGHATLASAYVLFNELNYSDDKIHFKAKLSDLFVTKQDDLLILDFPILNYETCDNIPDALIQGLGRAPSEVFIAHEDMNYFAIFDNEADITQLQVSLSHIEALHPYGLVVSAPSQLYDCVSRYFAPSFGIPEDPVTGSIHCVLVPYWAKRLNKTSIQAYQASPRTGELFCDLKGDRVSIAGYARKYMTATIHI